MQDMLPAARGTIHRWLWPHFLLLRKIPSFKPSGFLCRDLQLTSPIVSLSVVQAGTIMPRMPDRGHPTACSRIPCKYHLVDLCRELVADVFPPEGQGDIGSVPS